jgi:hypothetical protein
VRSSTERELMDSKAASKVARMDSTWPLESRFEE